MFELFHYRIPRHKIHRDDPNLILALGERHRQSFNEMRLAFTRGHSEAIEWIKSNRACIRKAATTSKSFDSAVSCDIYYGSEKFIEKAYLSEHGLTVYGIKFGGTVPFLEKFRLDAATLHQEDTLMTGLVALIQPEELVGEVIADAHLGIDVPHWASLLPISGSSDQMRPCAYLVNHTYGARGPFDASLHDLGFPDVDSNETTQYKWAPSSDELIKHKGKALGVSANINR